jgi:CRP-like cAMP-binding protein
MSHAEPDQNSNLLLQALPESQRYALIAEAEAVELPKGTVLFDSNETPRYAYFMTSGVASVVTYTADGGSAEVGLIGREGFTGSLHLLGPAKAASCCFIQVEGTALKVPFVRIQREFATTEAFRRLVLHFIQEQALMLEQLAACNRLHEAEERLARWLLMVQDRIQSDSINLTQEFLADMLGARRTTVSIAAGLLQRSGFIEYQRGQVRIRERDLLETAACECYGVVKSLFQGLY